MTGPYILMQIELRGPLPNEGDQQDDTISLLSEAESMTASIISTSSQRLDSFCWA